VSVETRLWWKAGWQFHWHHIVAYRKARLRLGTYSLPLFDAGAETVEVRDQFGLARDAQNGVAIQPILGFNQVRRQDSAPDTRVHILAWHSLVLLAETGWLTGEHDLIALSWVGRRTEESAPWTVASSYKGRILLKHPTLGDWQIEHPELPTEKSLVKTRTR
jgi:hypothetical protein